MAYKIVVLSLLIEGREEKERVTENRIVHTKTIGKLFRLPLFRPGVGS